MPDDRRIGVVIIGCGYMGGSGILAYEELLASLPGEGIKPEIVAVVEPEFDAYAIVAKFCFKFGPAPTCYHSLLEALPEIVRRAYNESLPIVVYDASPPKFHHSHLATLHDHIASDGNQSRPYKLLYIGEKPLVTDPIEIVEIRNFTANLPIFCDLIEGTNPVYEAVRNHIRENKLKIKSLKFWRASGGGTKIFIGAQRRGVQGGALLDKAPHDLSLSINLLGGNGVSGDVRAAEAHYLIPACDSKPADGHRSIVDAQNEPIQKINIDFKQRLNLPADGLCSVAIDWKSPEQGVVRGEYLFSWLGLTGHSLEHSFFQELSAHDVSPSDVVLEYSKHQGEIDQHPLSPTAPSMADAGGEITAATIEEVRIGIVRCEDRTIVCNLLEKRQGSIKRFAIEHIDGQPPRKLPIHASSLSGFALKGSELARVFHSIIHFAFGAPHPTQYGKEVSLTTHELLFAAQERALTALRASEFDNYFSSAFEIVQTKLRKTRVPSALSSTLAP